MVHSSPFPLDLAIAFHLWSQIQSEDAILETLKIKQWYFTPENKVLNHTNVDFCKIFTFIHFKCWSDMQRNGQY